jgi:probable phosphoglycerate mutase
MAGMPDRRPQVVAVRHGETVWSRDGRHTGRTDIPLTDQGRADARCLVDALAGRRFVRVLCSPLQRARETCALAGLAGREELCPNLMEWDYGEYEGLTSAQIQERRPGWLLWRDGCPGGELADDVAARADSVIAEITRALGEGDVALFSHGHLLRVLAARWVEQPAAHGARLMLDTTSISLLDTEHGVRALRRWNDVSHLPPERRPA